MFGKAPQSDSNVESTNKSWCPVPWSSSSLDNDGNFRLCVQANTHRETRGVLLSDDGKEFNAKTHRLIETRNCATLKDVRKTMLAGQLHPMCERCNREDRMGMVSRRVSSKGEMAKSHHPISFEKVQSLTHEDGSIEPQDFPIVDLDIRLGNRCNLKCRSCYPGESSGWYEEWLDTRHHTFTTSNKKGVILSRTKQGKVVAANTDTFLWYENSRFFEFFHKDVSHVEKIHCVGGEPLMIKEHYDLLETLVKEGLASQITLDYNSNLTMLPSRALNLWKEFKKVNIGVSIDGDERVNDYIRFPSKFSEVMKNVDFLNSNSENISIWFTLTVMIYNVFYLPDLIRWLVENSKGCETKENALFFAYHPLHNPVHLKVSNLPEPLKIVIKQKFNAFQSGWFEDHLRTLDLQRAKLWRERVEKIFGDVLEMLNEASSERHLAMFWTRTGAMDRYRQQNFELILPEIAKPIKDALSEKNLLIDSELRY